MNTLVLIFQHMYKGLLDIFFPKQEHIRHLEHMPAAEFIDRASRPLENPIGTIHIYSLFNYKDTLVQQALWELKYRGNRHIARLFASIIYDELLEKLSDMILFDDFRNPVIIPLPLSHERLRERGWNQSEMIARELKNIDKSKNFTVRTDILKKIRHTPAQTKLSKEKRLKNLKGCFNVSRPEAIKQKNIILLDDVTTTGSTLEEAARTLLKAGAKKVIGITVAH